MQIKDPIPLSETLEDYLEAILSISVQSRVARAMEIASYLHVSRPTVTVALRSLAEKGLINYEPRSYVTLTKHGEELARCITRRHQVLRTLFSGVLGLPETESERAACRMEHGMSAVVCRQITGLLNTLAKDSAFSDQLRERIAQESSIVHCSTHMSAPSACQLNVEQSTQEQ